MLARLTLIACLIGLAACGGSNDLTCDEGPYQSAVRGPKVQVPDDLDNLEPLREMPLPEASPRAERPEGAPCLDQPPVVIGTS
jgi:uncharacterized lipoprotein